MLSIDINEYDSESSLSDSPYRLTDKSRRTSNSFSEFRKPSFSIPNRTTSIPLNSISDDELIPMSTPENKGFKYNRENYDAYFTSKRAQESPCSTVSKSSPKKINRIYNRASWHNIENFQRPMSLNEDYYYRSYDSYDYLHSSTRYDRPKPTYTINENISRYSKNNHMTKYNHDFHYSDRYKDKDTYHIHSQVKKKRSNKKKHKNQLSQDPFQNKTIYYHPSNSFLSDTDSNYTIGSNSRITRDLSSSRTLSTNTISKNEKMYRKKQVNTGNKSVYNDGNIFLVNRGDVIIINIDGGTVTTIDQQQDIKGRSFRSIKSFSSKKSIGNLYGAGSYSVNQSHDGSIFTGISENESIISWDPNLNDEVNKGESLVSAIEHVENVNVEDGLKKVGLFKSFSKSFRDLLKTIS